MSDEDCKHCDQMLAERDDAQEWADELASRLAAIVGADIGDHSNLNNPWEEACGYADAVINARTGCGVWNPIDTAPHEVRVLMWSPDGTMEVGFASFGQRTQLSNGDIVSNMSCHGYATHWMPLPTPPADKK